MAASAVGAGVGHTVGTALAQANNGAGAFSSLGSSGGQLARGVVTGLAAGTAAAAMRGGKFSVQQVATDAFGNALGSSLAERSSGVDNTQLPTGDFARADRAAYELQQSIRQSDGIQLRRMIEATARHEEARQQQWISQSDGLQIRRFGEIEAAKAQGIMTNLPADYPFPNISVSAARMARGDAMLRAMSPEAIAGVAPRARSAAQLARERFSELTREMVRASEMAEANGVAGPLTMRSTEAAVERGAVSPTPASTGGAVPAGRTKSDFLAGLWDGFSGRLGDRVIHEAQRTPYSSPFANRDSAAERIGAVLADAWDDFGVDLSEGRISSSQRALKMSAPSNSSNVAPSELFRGGSSMQARLGVDVKPAADGLIHPLNKKGEPQGLSINVDPKDKFVQVHGGAFPVIGVPQGLQVVPSGRPGHYVLAPAAPMTLDSYQQLLDQTRLGNTNKLR